MSFLSPNLERGSLKVLIPLLSQSLGVGAGEFSGASQCELVSCNHKTSLVEKCDSVVFRQGGGGPQGKAGYSGSQGGRRSPAIRLRWSPGHLSLPACPLQAFVACFSQGSAPTKPG